MEKFDLDSYLEKRYSGLKLERIKKSIFYYNDLIELSAHILNIEKEKPKDKICPRCKNDINHINLTKTEYQCRQCGYVW